MTSEPQPLPAIFLFGPTAVGKTNLLELLAPDVYEVVSADSLQVYRRLDIGTAKPSLEARTRLRHHLIDIVDPREQFDVGEFVRLAENVISEIRARGRIPVVSGGAGFYLKQLLYGLPSVPAGTPEIRTIIQARLAELGLP
ncbi:MAG: tRNA (adenosine(37)-N6)-dimethylallyltransferase MiaA, partial [Spirochaetaceae bacterium]|nr:tRNA (adenosine(37)-N6)-dimethylallyltransferase MiaA [Spirochaetaceae bacterium]